MLETLVTLILLSLHYKRSNNVISRDNQQERLFNVYFYAVYCNGFLLWQFNLIPKLYLKILDGT